MSALVQIYADENFRPDKSGPAISTVGTFDGVHLGHRKILERLTTADSDHRVRTVVTFEPHPQNVMRHRPGLVPIITSTPEKVRLLKACGVDRVLILHFTRELSLLPAEEFLTQILLKRLSTTKLVVGYNHAFGRGREGNCEYLERVKDRFGFELEIVGPHYVAGETVSSSKIRRALKAGDLEKASRFLGRPYCLDGIVIPGKRMGHDLQFPTANLKRIHNRKLVPKGGVYTVAVGADGQIHPGMLNIGTCPTFSQSDKGASKKKDISIEVHLINYKGNLYDKTINILFLKRLREEKRFSSAQELGAQMEEDRRRSLGVYHSYQPGSLDKDIF